MYDVTHDGVLLYSKFSILNKTQQKVAKCGFVFRSTGEPQVVLGQGTDIS